MADPPEAREPVRSLLRGRALQGGRLQSRVPVAVHQPTVSVTVLVPELYDCGGFCTSRRLLDNRLFDYFMFGCYLGDGRSWNTTLIRVDGNEFRRAIPSSLFKHQHGLAEYWHTRRIPWRVTIDRFCQSWW